MNRFKASAIHLGISALVGLGMLVVMLGVWYPGGYFELLGGGGLLFLILGVDVTLGPLLTLVVFNPSKKSLKFDLAVIAAIQLSALVYGANVMFQSRPVFTVLEEDRFKVTLASDLKDETQLALAKKPEWRRLSFTGPVIVGSEAPVSEKEKEELTFAAVAGLDWNVFPKLYVEYDSQRSLALKNAKPLAQLRKVSVKSNQLIDELLEKEKRTEASLVYLPIIAGFTAMTAVLDAKNADFIAIINIDTP